MADADQHVAYIAVAPAAAPAAASRHGKARRWYTRGGRDAPKAPMLPTPGAHRSTACAIVPLYPNELTPPVAASDDCPASCTSRAHGRPLSAPSTCGFSTRSCAFGYRFQTLQPERKLQKPSHTCRRLGMPDVGFDSTDRQRWSFIPVLQHRCGQRTRLDRVAQRGARAVRLVQRQCACR